MALSVLFSLLILHLCWFSIGSSSGLKLNLAFGTLFLDNVCMLVALAGLLPSLIVKE